MIKKSSLRNAICAWYTFCTFASTALAAKVISAPFSHVSRLDAPPSLLAKRKIIQSNAANAVQLNYYYTNVTIGSPPQSVAMIIDTGSSDVWVPSTRAKPICGAYDIKCPLGTFDETRSSTFQDTNQTFSFQYQSLLSVSGDYMTDRLIIGGIAVNDLSMGLVTDGYSPPTGTNLSGIMGLSFDSTQGNTSYCPPTLASLSCTRGARECYSIQVAPCLRPGLLDRLVQQKSINTRAYSLYLGALEAREGNILFGGFDAAKYTPPLLSVPLVAKSIYFLIELTSVAAVAAGSASNQHSRKAFEVPQPVQVWIDSGTEQMLLPQPLASAIQAYAGAQVLPAFRFPIIDCRQSTNKSAIHFGLGDEGGPVIAVPIGQLVIPRFDSRGQSLHHDGRAVCEFAVWYVISSGLREEFILGDSFLRSAYQVYNVDNYTISFAQVIYNVTDTDIREIN